MQSSLWLYPQEDRHYPRSWSRSQWIYITVLENKNVHELCDHTSRIEETGEWSGKQTTISNERDISAFEQTQCNTEREGSEMIYTP